MNFSVNTAYQLAQLSKQQEIPSSYQMSKSFESILPSAQFQFKFSPKKNSGITIEQVKSHKYLDVERRTSAIIVKLAGPGFGLLVAIKRNYLLITLGSALNCFSSLKCSSKNFFPFVCVNKVQAL